MVQVLLKKALPHLIAIATFLVLNVVYFYPYLEGKVLQQSDVLGNRGMVREAVQHKENTGEHTLWTNSMFGGMPTYQIGGYGISNLLEETRSFLGMFFGGPIGTINHALISFYILFLVLGANAWLSLIGALAFSFATNSFVLWDTGHTNKLYVLGTSGLVIAGVLAAYWKRKYLLAFVLFAYGLGINLYYNHVQMTYYLFLCMVLYVILHLIEQAKKGELKSFITASVVLLMAGILAVGSSTSSLWTTYEYSKDTMRGEPILKNVSNTEAKSSSETSGLAYNYAMGWSAGYMDLMNVLIPRSVGGSSAEKIGTSSALYKDLTRKGASLPRDFRAPMYWGAIGSTSGTYYVGAIIILLFFLGAQIIKGPVKWWLVGSIIITFTIALGKNLGAINEPLFNYLPLMSKFRAPSSVLGVSAMFFSIMAILALLEVIKNKSRDQYIKPLYIAAGIAGGICLLFALLGGSLFDFAGQSDARLQQAGYDIGAIISDRKALLRNDSLRSLVFILMGTGLIWAFLKGKLKETFLLIGIGVLIVVDLWMVGRRYISTDDFVIPTRMSENFQPRPIDTQILNVEKSRGNYRVLDMSIDVFNSASTSYFHNTIGGYHPAKLQRYQDVIDRYIGRGKQEVLNMLNTKYFISQQQQLQTNPNALGPAWFVESIQKVNTPNEEIDALNTINPANQAAILDAEFNNYIGSFAPQKNGSINLIDYKPNYLTYQTNANSEQLAVFSEIWYGPDKGWQAYIDGKPVEHIRSNYILRAMKIPAGQHKVEFKFDPAAFRIGETISLASSGLIILLVLGFIGYQGFLMNKNVESFVEEKVEVTSNKKKPISKTVSKKNRKRKR